jgi:hypothetical protein
VCRTGPLLTPARLGSALRITGKLHWRTRLSCRRLGMAEDFIQLIVAEGRATIRWTRQPPGGVGADAA